jgi:hypothetical protein
MSEESIDFVDSDGWLVVAMKKSDLRPAESLRLSSSL